MPLISIFDDLQNWTQAREQLSITGPPRYARFQMELRSSRVVNLNFSQIFLKKREQLSHLSQAKSRQDFWSNFSENFFFYIVEKLIEDFVFFARRRRVDEGEGRWTKFDDWKNSSRFSASIVKVV